MQNRRLLFIAFASIVILGGLHIFGSTFYIYWTVWWFDNAMHFIGGLSLGLLSLWIAYMSGFFGVMVPTRVRVFVTVLLSVLVIGMGWEVFEYYFGIANPTLGETYFKDTIYDLTFDLLGAAIVGSWGSRRKFYSVNTR
jgi:hypothetical protein